MPERRPPKEQGEKPPADPPGLAAPNPEQVRQVLIERALEAYEDALARGLCAEGAWEAAVGAMRKLDLTERG